MKIRIGIGAAVAAATPDALGEIMTGLDELGFDSLWGVDHVVFLVPSREPSEVLATMESHAKLIN